MNFQKKLLLFLFVTWLGSCLSSYASFLMMEQYFHGIFYLGTALAVKTLAAALFSYKAEMVINKLGVRSSLIASQLFGFFSLLVIFLGFKANNFYGVIFGVMLTGVPSVLVTILFTFMLKVSANNDLQYRKDSGRRELVVGMAMLLAAILTPLLLMSIHLYGIILIDALSFIFGLLFLGWINFSMLPERKATESDSAVIAPGVLKSRDTWIFIFQTCASLSLVALVPIFASSQTIALTQQLPVVLRQWIWGVNALMWLCASAIYLLAKSLKQYWGGEFLVVCNGILLIPFLFFSNTATVFLVLIAVSLVTTISFFQFRDDYVLSAGSDQQRIASYSSFSQLQKNIVYFISPFLVGGLFVRFDLPVIIAMVFSIQVIAYGAVYLLRKSNKTSGLT